MKPDEAKNIIVDQFPSFEINSIEKIGEGWHSNAYRVNNDYVFRFPKIEKASKNLEKEICLLPRIESSLNLPIPHFKFIGKPSVKFDKYFVGYKEIKGKFLLSNVFIGLSDENKEDIAKTMAQFLEILHATPLEAVKGCSLEYTDFKKDYESDFKRMKEEVYSQISPVEQEWITKLFTDYLDDWKNFNYAPSLLHNDLSSDHVLLNEQNMRLNGIIDWGDVAIGDPDYDLMYLLDDYGENFITLMLKHYKHDDHQRLMKKLKFFQSCDDIHTILAGHSYKEQDKIDMGLKSLKEKIAQKIH